MKLKEHYPLQANPESTAFFLKARETGTLSKSGYYFSLSTSLKLVEVMQWRWQKNS
jgi:hypothetical protein